MINLFNKKGSVGLHTFSHSTSITTTYSVWDYEETTIYQNELKLATLNANQVFGSRAPYLQTNPDYFLLLKNKGITYDTSLTYTNSVTKKNYWPFTLDYGIPTSEIPIFCYFGICPTPQAGLWEVPMTSFDYDVMANVMDPPMADLATANVFLEKFKTNYDDSYTYNKVPRGFYTHFRYLSIGDLEGVDSVKQYFVEELYKYLISKPKVVFATEAEVIKWIKNPVPYSQLQATWQCGDSTNTYLSTCTPKMCSYNQEIFIVCSSACPTVYPGLNVVWSFPPTTNYPSNSAFNHWLGTATIYLYKETSAAYPYRICADGMKIKHSNSGTAKSFILTLKFCKSQIVNIVDAVYSVWGYPVYSADISGDFFIFKIRGNNVTMKKTTSFTIGGFCLNLKDFDTYNNFSLTNHFKWGLDYFDKPLDCEVGQCKIYASIGTVICPARRILEVFKRKNY